MTRIPAKLRLPFGYVVLVKQVPYQDFCHLSGDATAYWDSAEKILYLDKDLPLVERRYWLMSQMHHVLLDCVHEMLDSGLIKPNA